MSRQNVGSIVSLLVFCFATFSAAAEPAPPTSWPNRDGISAETGWKSTWPGDELPVAWSHQIGIGFSSISIAGGRLFTMGHVDGDEIVWCLDAKTGDKLWTHRYPCALNDNLHEGGPGATPTIDGEHVYTLGKEGQLYCLNVETGKVVWEIQLQKDLNVGVPEWGFSSSPEVAFQSWPSPFRTNSTTPIVEGDQIFISTAYNVGCGLFKFDGQSLKEIYANKEMRNHFNNSILLDGNLYGFDGNSNLGRVVQLTCMNLQTGKVAWKQRGMGCGSLMIADGKLLILSENGKLTLAKAKPDGFEELASSPFLTGRCWTVPVLFEKRVYGRNAAGKIVCVKLP